MDTKSRKGNRGEEAKRVRDDNAVESAQNSMAAKKSSNRFWQKCFANRKSKGMLMLDSNVEKKIYQLKKTLRAKGVDGEEIKQIIRKRRRQEELKYRRAMTNGCFNCRQMGHKLANCPLIKGDVDQGVDICYRCGSTEHKLSECSVKSNDLPFAKCFLCGEQGHLTRDCSQNERGVYPKGGCCKECGSVNHLVKDCPQLQNKDSEQEAPMTLPTLDSGLSADAELLEEKAKPQHKKPKIVKF